MTLALSELGSLDKDKSHKVDCNKSFYPRILKESHNDIETLTFFIESKILKVGTLTLTPLEGIVGLSVVGTTGGALYLGTFVDWLATGKG